MYSQFYTLWLTVTLCFLFTKIKQLVVMEVLLFRNILFLAEVIVMKHNRVHSAGNNINPELPLSYQSNT